MAQKEILLKPDGYCHVRGSWDSNYDLSIPIYREGSNGSLNAAIATFLFRNDPSGAVIEPQYANGGGGDDTAPFWYNVDATDDAAGALIIIGGNHAYAAKLLTMPGSDKTIADVGSVWQDASNGGQWVIVSTNTDFVAIAARNMASAGQIPKTTLTPNFPLTHVSGAVHTTAIPAPTGIANGSLYGYNKSDQYTIEDEEGVEHPYNVAANTTYQWETLKVKETKVVLDPFSALEKLIALRPTGGYTSDQQISDAIISGDALVTIETAFLFGKEVGQLVVENTLTANKKIEKFDWWSGQQECHWGGTSNTSVMRYIPFFKEYTGPDGVTRNWATGRDMMQEPIRQYELTPDLWVDGIPPNRVVEHTENTNNVPASSHQYGILHTGSAYGREVRNMSAAFEIGTGKKYLKAFDPKGPFTLLPGQQIKVVTTKCWVKPATAPLSFELAAEHGHDRHYFVDFNQSGTKTYTLPAGFTFQPFRKSRNVVHAFSGNTVTITANVTTANPTAHFEFALLASQAYIESLPVNCLLSNWSGWSAWDAQTESRTRTRTITRQPANGGTACGPTSETQQVPQTGWGLKLSGTNLTGQSAQPLPAMSSLYGFVRFKLLDNTPNDLLQLSSNWLSPAGKGAWIIRVNDYAANILRFRNYGNVGAPDYYITGLQIGEWITVAFEIDQTRANELGLSSVPAKTYSPSGGGNTNGLVSDYLQIGSSSVEISDVWIRETKPTAEEKEAILAYL